MAHDQTKYGRRAGDYRDHAVIGNGGQRQEITVPGPPPASTQAGLTNAPVLLHMVALAMGDINVIRFAPANSTDNPSPLPQATITWRNPNELQLIIRGEDAIVLYEAMGGQPEDIEPSDADADDDGDDDPARALLSTFLFWLITEREAKDMTSADAHALIVRFMGTA